MTPTFEEFVDSINPKIKHMYEIECMSDEELLNKEVVAIRSGFSCSSEGGTVMVIDSLKNGWVHFSSPVKLDNRADLGWGCKRGELSRSVILNKPTT